MTNNSLIDEFEFLIEPEQEETTFEEDSNELIQQANRFIENTNIYPDKTYQGIMVTAIRDSLFIGKTDIMPWEHVSFILDVNKLKYISGEKLKELTVPSFVEELSSIGYKAETEFGYNQAFRNKLKEIYIPKNIVVIASSTFAFYNKLERIEFDRDSKLMYLGSQAFACCSNLKTLDLRNCIYLDEIKENTFTNSGIETLKLNSSIRKIGNIEKTNIKIVYIDNEKYSIDEFLELMRNSNNEVFWTTTDYNF